MANVACPFRMIGTPIASGAKIACIGGKCALWVVDRKTKAGDCAIARIAFDIALISPAMRP